MNPEKCTVTCNPESSGCTQCATQLDAIVADNFHVRIETLRHHFNERERLFIDWLLAMRVRLGKSVIRVARLEDFGRLLGTHRGHVHEIIASLHRANVLEVRAVAGGMDYTLNTDSRAWKKEVRANRADIEGALGTIVESNGDAAEFFAQGKGGKWSLLAGPRPGGAPVVADLGTVPFPAPASLDPTPLPELL